MRSPGRSTMIWAIAAATTALAAYLWLGAGGLVLAAVAGTMALIWKYDNWSGSCFMLAVLVLITIAVLLLLIALMALPR